MFTTFFTHVCLHENKTWSCKFMHPLSMSCALNLGVFYRYNHKLFKLSMELRLMSLPWSNILFDHWSKVAEYRHWLNKQHKFWQTIHNKTKNPLKFTFHLHWINFSYFLMFCMKYALVRSMVFYRPCFRRLFKLSKMLRLISLSWSIC